MDPRIDSILQYLTRHPKSNARAKLRGYGAMDKGVSEKQAQRLLEAANEKDEARRLQRMHLALTPDNPKKAKLEMNALQRGETLKANK